MSQYTDLVARTKQIDSDNYLGRLVWYSVSLGAAKIQHSLLVQALFDCKLEGHLPRLPSDVDVFRRVCTAGQRKRVAVAGGQPGDYANYLVRDVRIVGTATVRKLLVRETVSGKLKYTADLCTIDFRREDSAVFITCDQSDQVACEIAADIRSNYYAEKGTIGSYGVRELIRKVLMGCNATNVRGNGGGVYFVSEAYGDTVEQLELLATKLPGDILVHSLPLLDDGKQRAMLRRAFEADSVEETQRMVNEIADLIASGAKITAQKMTDYYNGLTASRSKVREYTGLLEENMDTASAKLSILQAQILKLSAQVEEVVVP